MKPSYTDIMGRLVVLIALLLVNSCGEKSEPEPTKAELITQNWNLRSVTVNGQNENISGYTIRFQSNGSYSFNTPGISGLPPSGTWVLNTSETAIILSGSIELSIRNLTKTNFSFDYSYQNHKEGNVLVQFVLGV